MTKTEVLQKLTRDLEMRGRSIETIKEYTSKVRLFQDYYDKSADQMGEKEIIDYLYYLVTEKEITPQSVNTYNSALRFVYSVTLDVVLNYKKLPRLKQNRRIPQIFTKEEIRKILDSSDSKIHRVMLMLAYGSGLRLSEITNLKASDIESGQMRILVRQGKGNRDRYHPKKWQDFLNILYQKDWYVYCKRPFKTSNSVISYLGRYTHRVAIANHRILSVKDTEVSFKWRDYRDEKKEKVMTLSVDEFMRRFLLHILPPGFTKIRHYGFLSAAAKKKKLTLCKRLTGAKITIKVPEKLSYVELMQVLTGRDITLCPRCGKGHFVPVSGLAPPVAV